MVRHIKHEHRRHTRVNLAVPAKLLIPNDEEQQCTVLDVSIEGAALLVPNLIAKGARCMTSFDIDIHGGRKRINALGEAIYSEQIATFEYRLGVKFIDMDAYSQLLLRDLTI